MSEEGAHPATSPSPGRNIPFSRPSISPATVQAVMRAMHGGNLTGGGRYTDACHDHLRALFPGTRPFLTTSCTAALEMAALVLRVQPGDEVIMPSWTFPSTANAFALRGATPVFVDIDPGTLNIDPNRANEALTSRTRAICCVHYAGVACDMGALLDLCRTHGLALVEDAAQGYGSSWAGRPLGGIGDAGAFSFHGTKNISSGEGGALIVARPDLVPFAEISWEKGTDRLRYQRGETVEYEWQDLGSSFLPSDLTAALLVAQLAQAEEVNARRLAAWNNYDRLLREAGAESRLVLPIIPADTEHNGHIYAVRLHAPELRRAVVAEMVAQGIDARSHYRPLHTAAAGRRYGRVSGTMRMTEQSAAALIRLPIDSVITPAEQERVVDTLLALLG